jgi:hypothetical protein
MLKYPKANPTPNNYYLEVYQDSIINTKENYGTKA